MPANVPFSRAVSPGRRLALCAVVLVGACDAQASTAYRGQPLLSMSGSVELALDATTQGELSPALAFFNPQNAAIEIVDVEAQGEFPAEFAIQVYERPPQSAFFPIWDEQDAPEAALAFITAVTPEHPDAIEFADTHEISVRPSSCNGGPCACPESGCVRSESKLCTRDGETCFVEKVTCPQSDSPEEDCTVEYSGDPSVGDDPWKNFAGLSQNYAIVYVHEALAAGARAAITLGTRDALAEGYNLLSLRALTQEERVERQSCAQDAGAIALQRFNREHGTDYDELTIMGLTCGPGVDDRVFCPQPASPEESEDYYALTLEVAAEEGCLQTEYLATRIDDAEAEPITIRIGQTLDPLSELSAAGGPMTPPSSSPVSTPTPESP
jgi:hypothetical protein